MRSLIPLVLWSLVACSSGDTPSKESAAGTPASDALELPPVDAAEATKVQQALKSVPPDMRAPFGAMALAEIEAQRLPPPFIEGLKALSNAPPEMRSMLLAKAISESMPIVAHLCDKPIDLLQSIAQMAPEQRGPAIYEGCKLERFGLVTRAQLPQREPMMLLIGHVALDHLSRAGELHPGERAAIEAIVSAEPPPPMGDEY